MKSNVKKPEVVKNNLSEKIIDINKLMLNKGSVLLELIDKNPKSEIIVPEGFDKGEMIYYKVVKTGDDDFKKLHPEFESASHTKIGNIIISIKPTHTPILVNKDKEYIVVSDHSIDAQVTSDNFMV